MSERVILVNVSKGIETVNLSHAIFCKGAGECSCKWNELLLAPHERKGPVKKLRKVRTCASIILPPRTESAEFDATVLLLPEVQAATQSRPRRMIVKKANNGG
jgi:hypothetical protein